jgi:hypothetical protein
MAVADSVQNVGTDNIQAGAVTNAKLANDSITINGSDTALGTSVTVDVPTARNLIINGAMEVSQKGGGSHTTSAQTYWIDRFYTFTHASAGRTISQSSNAPDGFRKSIKLQRDSGSSDVNVQYLSQPAESASCVGFAGKKITLSFYARAGADFSPTSDNISVSVYTGTGTDQTLMGGLTGSALVISATQALTTSWVRYEFTGASVVPTSSNQLVVQLTNTPVGTASTNDWYEITVIQIETGESATDFVHEEYGTTLAKCQRFFLNYVDGNTKSIGVGGFYNTTIVACHIQPTVTFREAPSFAFGSGTGWYYADRDGTSTTGNWTAASWAQLNSVGFYGGFGTSTSGQVAFLRTNNSGAYIWFDAEM